MEEEHYTHIVEEKNIGFKKASVETEGGHFEEPKKSVKTDGCEKSPGG